MPTNKVHNNEGNKSLTTSGHMIQPNDIKEKGSHITHSSTSQFNLAESANKPQMASQSTRLRSITTQVASSHNTDHQEPSKHSLVQPQAVQLPT